VILVAPDKFKGTFPAPAVAAAIAAGIGEAGVEAAVLPVADGGEGTAAVIVGAVGGEWHDVAVTDALGREVEAWFALFDGGERAVLDMASASGLDRIAADERDPWRASTAGTGELILAAAAAGAREVVVAAGGSATVDGGAGAIAALRRAERLPRLVVACDVATPWERAAAVYGPQKGADPELVERLARRLDDLAAEAPRDPRGVPMGGAAGGLAGGLWAHFAAELVAGADFVLDAIGFDAAAAEAAAVVTGEGKLDEQTLEGKAVAVVAGRAAALGVPCDAVVGVDALGPDGSSALGLRRVVEARTLAEMRVAGRSLAAPSD
jgi:glycerate kinase